MILIDDIAISYDDITIQSSYSALKSRQNADISIDNYSNPIINSPMIHTCSFNMLKYFINNNMLTTIHRYFNTPMEQLEYVKSVLECDYSKVFFSCGKDTNWIQYLVDNGVTKILLDFAHGWSIHCMSALSYIRDNYGENIKVIVGNIDNGKAYRELINIGGKETIIRAGLASGGICSTNLNTGIGIPIITSILECSEIKNEIGGKIICDGGITNGGRIAKAIACGADYVMIGGLLGATNLAKGPFYDANMNKCNPKDSKYVEFFGMASSKARAFNNSHNTAVSIEGVSGYHKYEGDTDNLIKSLEMNMRASISYVGATDWESFKRDVVIRRISTSGQIEKMTHLSKYD